MATTLAATGRIVFPYTCSSQPHIFHMYVRNPQLVGGNWLINSRTTDANDTDWTAAADRIGHAWDYAVGTGTTYGVAQLQTRSGLVWTTVATHTVTPGALGGSITLTTQLTMTLRDTSFRKVKVDVMEGRAGYLFHTTDPLGGDATMDNFTNCFCIGTGHAADPFNVMVGRGNAYLTVNPFVALTVCPNRKLRRARGYA